VVSRCVAGLPRLMQAEWQRMDRDVRVDSGILFFYFFKSYSVTSPEASRQ
jgi:hypothetical protein